MHSLALASPTPPLAVFPAHCSLRFPHYLNAWNRLRSRVDMGGFVSNCIMAGALGTLRLLLLDITRVKLRAPKQSHSAIRHNTRHLEMANIYYM